jgi:hypothetical protein
VPIERERSLRVLIASDERSLRVSADWSDERSLRVSAHCEKVLILQVSAHYE